MKKDIQKKLLGYEAVGFSIIFILLWLDEILDLPHYLMGAPATPINWRESLLESFCVLVLGSYVIYLTYRIIKKLKYLEGFLPVCSFCKKIRIEDEWVQMEKYITEHSEAVFSHSLCPECTEEHYGDILRKAKDIKEKNEP